MPLRAAISKALAGMTLSESVGALLTRLGILRGTESGASSVAFTVALIALAAKLARSDGAVSIGEFEAFKRIVELPEGEEANVRRLFDLAKQDVAGYETYARQVGLLLKDEPDIRHDVLEALFLVAASDGALHEKELTYLETVSRLIGIPQSEFHYVRSLFVRDGQSPYELLGLTPAASNDEIKARHRQIVREHHPDRLVGRGLSSEFVAAAERHVAAVNAAFDAISAERGL